MIGMHTLIYNGICKQNFLNCCLNLPTSSLIVLFFLLANAYEGFFFFFFLGGGSKSNRNLKLNIAKNKGKFGEEIIFTN